MEEMLSGVRLEIFLEKLKIMAQKFITELLN